MTNARSYPERRQAPHEVTPIDELTGIPLPLLNPFTDEYPAAVYPPNWHHTFHPASSDILTRDAGGRALRACRVQKVNYKMHSDYHRLYQGSFLPEDTDAQFRMVVLAAAGYMPDYALQLNAKGQSRVVGIEDQDREYLWRSSQLKVWNPDVVRGFLREYILEQDLSHISHTLIDELLHTKNDRRKLELGYNVLGIAANQATENMKDVYRIAVKSRLLPPERTERASRFVLGSLGLRKNRKKTVHALTTRLAIYG